MCEYNKFRKEALKNWTSIIGKKKEEGRTLKKEEKKGVGVGGGGGRENENKRM